MDIKLSIDVTDKALEFSRNMGSLFVNLGVIDKESMERSANRPVQKALDEHAEKVNHEPPVDAPWNTDPIEPDPIKVDDAKEMKAAKPSHTLVELRERGATFAQVKGKSALKKVLGKYGLPKLTAPEAVNHFDELWKDLEV